MTTDPSNDPLAGTDEGARLRSVEIEVQATPAQVWQAIATTEGTAGWLFPTEYDERVGGDVRIHRQPYGGTAEATVVAWEPEHRLVYAEPQTTVPGGDEQGEPWTTELLIEAKSGGTCIVRVVSGFHRHGEAWEPLVDGAAEGWKGALAILQAYLAHFAGRHCAVVDATITVPRPPDAAADVANELLDRLGLTGLQSGDAFRTPPGPPPLAGVVEGNGLFAAAEATGRLLRVDEPAPALVEVSGFFMGGDGVQATVALRFYGDDADAAAAEHGPRWQAWIAEAMSS